MNFLKPKAWKTLGSYLHWRLETYGVYYPGGKFNGKAFISLVLQLPAYLRWQSHFSKIRKQHPASH
jgi:hypothetical protein